MNQNFDLAYAAISNKEYEYYLLTYQSKKQYDEKDLASLTTKWKQNLKKNIPDTGALILINNGNFVLLIKKKDAESILLKLNSLYLSEKRYKTSVTKLSKEELIKFTIQ